MTTTTIRRAMILFVAIGMMLAGTVVPAFAVATGTASLADTQFFAGTTATLDVTVRNTASSGGLPILQPGGSSIDAVQILVDDAVVDPTNVAPPTGWTGSYNAARGTAYYFANEGSEIPPGGSLTFSLPSRIEPQSADRNSSVIVQVSDNGGATATNAGVLGFAIKILEVVTDSVTIVKPVTTQAANLVTEQQDTADIRLRVKNYASTAKSIVASASKNGGSSSVTTSESAPQVVNPGQVGTFTFDAVFGAPGSLDILGEASTDGGEAVTDVFEGVTVQQAIALGYGGDLTPLAAVPGSTETFTLSVNKSGGPGGVLDTTLAFASASGPSRVNVGPSAETKSLSYSVSIPSTIADGEYPATLTYSGTDANGAVVAEVTRSLDDIILDSLRPILDLVLTPPTSAVQGAEDAAGAGDSVSVSGAVNRASGPCGSCLIEDETVTFLDAAGNTTGTQPGPDLTNSNGTISGSFTMPSVVPAGTTSVRLSATALRAENLLAGADSSTATVDIIAPVGIDSEAVQSGARSLDGSVVTTGRDGDGDFVDVPFSELVGFGPLATAGDWAVDNNLVRSVQYLDGSAAGTGKVRLRLAQALDRNATPTVTYTPRLGGLARAFDRVELSLADQALEALDNIVPDVLGIIEVSTYRGSESNDTDANRIDQGSFDGVFYTRDRTPVVTVNNVAIGDTVRVFRDGDGDGVQDPGESTLGQLLSAGGTTAEVQLTNLGATETLIDISAYAIDAAGNAGLGSVGDQLQLDFTLPTIEGFARSGNQITVTFSEAVPVGRDAAFDWLVLSEGRWRPVDAVTNADGDAVTRTLTINGGVVPGDVSAVRWESVTADTGDDYADIARNEADPTGLQYSK